MDTYLTIKASSEGIYKAKASKFLAFAFPVKNEQEVKGIVSQLKKDYYDAKHHCYAYVMGFHQDKCRENDDGEPTGTAGKPIHGQIKSKNLTDILIVVVRYFGGTKLGVSGLIEAYKTAAADAIAKADIVEKIIMKTHKIFFTYEQTTEVMKLLKAFHTEFITQEFDNNCMIEFAVRQAEEELVLSKIEEKMFNFE